MPEAPAVETTPEPTTATAPVANDVLYEVINGRVVEKPPMGINEALIATTLAAWIYHSGGARRVGRVVTEGLFQLDPSGGLRRRPDVAFVSYNRSPRRPVEGEAWKVVPDLAIEVVSPSNTATEVLGKLEDYFRVGVGQVWVIYPDQAKVYVYGSPTDLRVLQPDDHLDGGAVIPGFRMPVRELFEDGAEPAGA